MRVSYFDFAVWVRGCSSGLEGTLSSLRQLPLPLLKPSTRTNSQPSSMAPVVVSTEQDSTSSPRPKLPRSQRTQWPRISVTRETIPASTSQTKSTAFMITNSVTVTTTTTTTPASSPTSPLAISVGYASTTSTDRAHLRVEFRIVSAAAPRGPGLSAVSLRVPRGLYGCAVQY